MLNRKAFIMVTEEDVRKIAELAHLAISQEEVSKYQKQLNSILQYIDQLKSIDVSSVEAMTHVHGQTNVFRDDLVRPSMPVEDALRNAPDTSGQFIRVPIIKDI